MPPPSNRVLKILKLGSRYQVCNGKFETSINSRGIPDGTEFALYHHEFITSMLLNATCILKISDEKW
jgi:hypothetical protein